PAAAQHQGLDLLLREHQRRQHEARPQDVADTRLAIDMRTLALQRIDVAVERAQRDAEFIGERRPRHRKAVTAQNLDQVEETLGARHALPLRGRLARPAANLWQHQSEPWIAGCETYDRPVRSICSQLFARV